MDFSLINRASQQSFAEQKQLIKKVCRGQKILCDRCGQVLKLYTPNKQNQPTGIRCDKGCTDILLSFNDGEQ